ncbi:MAG: M24 family metallopeptidase [Actinomycetia bacterium]|nr:M24 family metallopeptidase [Actinomycetes bacterium]
MLQDVNLPFGLDEYRSRLAKTRVAMAERGIEVLFVSDPSNMCWLTGYDAWSFYTFQGVIVSLEDDPIYWGRNMDTQAARRTTWLDEDHIVPYPDNYVQNPEHHPMQHLAEVLNGRGMSNSRIGVEADNYYYSAKADQSLRTSLGRDDLIDVTGLVNWQRAVKSAHEIQYMRIAGSILELVYEHIGNVIRPGMRKNDLVAEILHASITGTPEHGGDYAAIVPLLPTGADATASHLTWNDAPMEKGAGTFLELAGCFRRYHAPLCRSFFLGTPPPEVVNAEAALVEALSAGIDVARSGNTAADVANALASVLAKYGIDRGGARCGYPIGLSYPPDWGERTISLRPEDTTVLEPGMTFHFMPGLWMQDWGLEITETILITESGPAECLLDVDRSVMVFD